jgi:hypothetical protein
LGSVALELRDAVSTEVKQQLYIHQNSAKLGDEVNKEKAPRCVHIWGFKDQGLSVGRP